MKPHLLLSGRLGLLLVALAALMIATGVAAQSGGSFDLSWSSADGGGGTSTGGSYSLSGTLGQADAGAMSGGTYSLSGGFWGGAVVISAVYLPVLLR